MIRINKRVHVRKEVQRSFQNDQKFAFHQRVKKKKNLSETLFTCSWSIYQPEGLSADVSALMMNHRLSTSVFIKHSTETETETKTDEGAGDDLTLYTRNWTSTKPDSSTLSAPEIKHEAQRETLKLHLSNNHIFNRATVVQVVNSQLRGSGGKKNDCFCRNFRRRRRRRDVTEFFTDSNAQRPRFGNAATAIWNQQEPATKNHKPNQ